MILPIFIDDWIEVIRKYIVAEKTLTWSRYWYAIYWRILTVLCCPHWRKNK